MSYSNVRLGKKKKKKKKQGWVEVIPGLSQGTLNLSYVSTII